MKRIIVFTCLIICLTFLAGSGKAAEVSGQQILTSLSEIFKANPALDKKVQMVGFADPKDQAVTVYAVKITPGGEVKYHKHEFHSETLTVVSGTGQLFINNQWVELKPGSVHYNPPGQVHALKNLGPDELLLTSVFGPAMDPDKADRVFVDGP